jgi:hypothetical protein
MSVVSSRAAHHQHRRFEREEANTKMSKLNFGLFAAITVVLTFCPCWLTSAQKPAASKPSVAPWNFRSDWTQGFSGWMSFPLAQDVGYDPSLYTEKQGSRTVLVHNFRSHGETRPQLGLIRPLKFFAGPQARIEVGYRLKIAGGLSGLARTATFTPLLCLRATVST